MRIDSLEVSGFRGFSGREHFDLDADTVVVAGANGQGKTSFFDAIFWAIAGRIPRLGPDASIVSMYSESGEARVVLGLRNERGSNATVVRSSDATASLLLLEMQGQRFRGAEAEGNLLRLLWPQGLAAAEPEQALISALERSVYLQQDLVREFIEAESDQERFTAISELVGAGRVTELQVALERSRTAWSKVTNTRAAEAEARRERLESLQARLESLTAAEPELQIDRERWQSWWDSVRTLGVAIGHFPEPDSIDAARALDTAVKQLQALQLANDRRVEAVSEAISDLEALPPAPGEDLDGLRAALQAAREAVQEARSALADAEQRAAALRRRQTELVEEREQLRVFAELALRHLGERCPVCQQAYDHKATRRRLEELARPAADGGEQVEEMPDISALAESLLEREQAALAAANRLGAAEEAVRDWEVIRGRLLRRLEQLGLASEPEEHWRGRLEELVGVLENQTAALAQRREEGEDFALAVARTGQQARRGEVQREIGTLRQELELMEADNRARERTGELVAEMLRALRSATSDVVGAQLEQVEPLLQRIYATADPHPAFRIVRLLTSMSRGRGRVTPAVGDPVADLVSDAPGAVLSSSQLNVLAVSVFLALNLGLPSLPLQTAILDDPLQSLDDLNLLGLIDLLRRTRERRQLFISTHDARFAELLERKLRPVAEGQRTVVIELEGWGRGGPMVAKRDIPQEATALRMAG